MDPLAIRVLIRNAEGRFLTGFGPEPTWDPSPAAALVLDFLADRVAERVAEAGRERGQIWTIVRADPRAGHEVCDRCGHRVMAFLAVFDGTQFLCRDCAPKP